MNGIQLGDPLAVGSVFFVLMSLDRILTIAQQREMNRHYGRHFAVYPVNTIEGNPAMQDSVRAARYFAPRHLVLGAVLAVLVGIVIASLPAAFVDLGVGYFLGLFLLVNTQHLSNLVGYYLGRKGVHGRMVLHQRTALLTQSGRYFSWFMLLMMLFGITSSRLIAGVALAALFSSLRQLIWLRRVAQYNEEEERALDSSDEKGVGADG